MGKGREQREGRRQREGAVTEAEGVAGKSYPEGILRDSLEGRWVGVRAVWREHRHLSRGKGMCVRRSGALGHGRWRVWVWGTGTHPGVLEEAELVYAPNLVELHKPFTVHLIARW